MRGRKHLSGCIARPAASRTGISAWPRIRQTSGAFSTLRSGSTESENAWLVRNPHVSTYQQCLIRSACNRQMPRKPRNGPLHLQENVQNLPKRPIVKVQLLLGYPPVRVVDPGPPGTKNRARRQSMGPQIRGQQQGSNKAVLPRVPSPNDRNQVIT